MEPLHTQEIPQLITFLPEDYGALEHNWMITQDCAGNIFVANSAGILRYNGFSWQKIPFENQGRVRAIFRGEDCKIYAGGYQSFGYLAEKGHQWFYHAISDSLIQERKEEIWHIFGNDERILFQSFAEVYDYDYETIRLNRPPQNIMFGANVRNQLLLPKIRGGLMNYAADQNIHPLEFDHAFPVDIKIVGICPLEQEAMLVATQFNGLFIIKNKDISPVSLPIQELVKASQINRLLQLSDGHIVVGTIQNGIYILNKDLEVVYHINRQLGLSNNSILALYEDQKGDLWIGTDNGLNLLKWSNPNRFYYDRDDRIGKIFETIEHEGKHFLGTNKGLFIKKPQQFHYTISELKGQVWALWSDDMGNLLIGHNEGTFLYKQGHIRKISNDVTGGLKMDLLAPNLILQSTYTGWILLEFKNNTWQFKQRISGLAYSFINYIRKGQVVYGFNRNEGLLKLVFNEDFSNIESYQVVQEKFSISAETIMQFYKKQEKIFFCIEQDCYEINNLDYQPIGREKSIALLQEQQKITQKKEIRPTQNGYQKIYTNVSNSSDSIFINYLLVNGKHRMITKSPLQLNSSENTIELQLARVEYGELPKYQYAVISDPKTQDHWQPLSKDGKIRLQDLRSKSYKVLLRKPDNATLPLLHFKIAPPWYASWQGWFLYAFLIIAGAMLLIKYQNQKAQLAQQKLLAEKEKELEKTRIIAKNNELEREVKHKSQLLANSAMTLIQKNKMLNELKAFLQKELNAPNNIRATRNKVVHLINRNINSDEDWQIFENNFNQIHQDFMDRLKADFDDLSVSELKLAAYIRMGLLSKEIAPLLNISNRSVENKRSFLRKKLGLSSSDNLRDFIMNY